MALCKKKPRVEEKAVLKKEIGILQGVSIIIGVIVGSGIFVSPVGVLKHTHSVGLSFIMWLMTGLFSIIGALVYAELGVTIPLSGGEYIYILKTFGGMLAFCCLWITFLLIGAASTAANAFIFAQYLLKPIFIETEIPLSAQICLGLFAVFTLLVINCINVKWATKLAVVFTTGKVAALLLIVGLGFYNIFMGRSDSFMNSFDESNFNPGSLSLAFYHGFWAFAGWNYLNFLTEEMKNPARNLPIAILLSLIIVTSIYLLVNVAYLGVLSPNEMLVTGSSSAIAVEFADRTLGSFSWIMSVFVAASVFGSMNGEILSMSRLTFAGAQEKHLPIVISMISKRFLTPMPSIIIMGILIVLFQVSQNVFYLIELAGFAFTVIFAMATCSLLYIRKYHPDWSKGFRLHISVPIIFLIVDVFVAFLALYQQPKESLIGLGIMGLGIPIYLVGVTWKNKPESLNKLTYADRYIYEQNNDSKKPPSTATTFSRRARKGGAGVGYNLHVEIALGVDNVRLEGFLHVVGLVVDFLGQLSPNVIVKWIADLQQRRPHARRPVMGEIAVKLGLGFLGLARRCRVLWEHLPRSS